MLIEGGGGTRPAPVSCTLFKVPVTYDAHLICKRFRRECVSNLHFLLDVPSHLLSNELIQESFGTFECCCGS